MNGRNRELLAHLAVALARYEREYRGDGFNSPPELLALAGFFADCATARQDATEGAGPAGSVDAEAMKEHPLLTKREVAAALRCSTRTVDRLIASGALAAVKVEGATRIRRTDLAAYIAGLSPRSFRDSIEEKDTA